MKVIAYTDGSYMERGDLKVYGSAAIYKIEGEEKWKVLKFADNDPEYIAHRNVSGEILAVIALCNKLLDMNIPDIEVTINYDYDGIMKWPTGLWKANKELPRIYRDYMNNTASSLKINYNHVKGHEDLGNIEVDKFAKQAVYDKLEELSTET